MAQDFEGKAIRVTNSETVLRTADSDDAYLVKDAPIPTGGSLELIDGGSKVVLMSGDRLLGQCGTANGIDAWISTVDAVST